MIWKSGKEIEEERWRLRRRRRRKKRGRSIVYNATTHHTVWEGKKISVKSGFLDFGF